MSKIKANRLEPRTETGTLTIGNPTGATTFEGDVIIPQYATLDHIESIVAGDLAVELTNYQKRDEKNVPDGYAGLDANGHVPAAQIDGSFLPLAGGTMTGDIDMSGQRVKDIAQIPLEETDAASKYYVDASTETINHPVDVQVFPAVNEFTEIFGVRNGGTSCMRVLGSGDWWSNQGRIREIADPIDQDDAATKGYVDNTNKMGQRRFQLAASAYANTNVPNGSYFFTTTNNAAYTNTLANAKYVTFSMVDRGGNRWGVHDSSTGQHAMPPGHFMLHDDTYGILGWWAVAGTEVAFAEGTTKTSVIFELGTYTSTSVLTIITTGKDYGLSMPWW